MNGDFDPISMALTIAMVATLPLMAVMMSSFLKIAVVMSLLRNALGVQQIPPNMAIYGLSLILSVYVMAPVVNKAAEAVRLELAAPASGTGKTTVGALMDAAAQASEPLRAFMVRNSNPDQRDFFIRTARHLWGEELARDVKQDDLLVLVPAFLVSELNAAFQIGFLLYLPFVIIDLIVSNILLALGMMMVSPVTISMPLKLFLFVMVDGWTRLIQGLVLSYS